MPRIRLYVSTVLVACAIAVSSAGHAASVWIEGEDASRSKVTPHNWYGSVKTDVFSGSRALMHYNKDKAGSATYAFDAPEDGAYVLWFRANPLRSRTTWQIDDSAESVVPWKNVRERINIASDNKPDMRFLAWVRVGTVKLKQGAHTLTVGIARGDEKIPHHGVIDCIALAPEGWVPSGTTRPGQSSSTPAGPDTWFPAVAGKDPLSDESVIDMSRLINAPAGKHGFLKADGAALRFENADAPVKFWGVNANLRDRQTDEEMRHAARWLRKYGVNIVRQHTLLQAVGLPDATGRFDPNKLDRYDRWFAALKEQGIYTTWSVIYPHHGPMLRAEDGLPADRFAEVDAADQHRDSPSPVVSGDFINIDRDIQDLTLKFFKALLEHVNPHTGLAYKDDPALAVVEFQNESNVFFHTLNPLAQGKFPVYAQRMRKAFFEYAKATYGDKAAVAEAWGGHWHPKDEWENGELAIMGAYHWGADGPMYEFKGQTRRAGDYIRFLTKMQRAYYERRRDELRALEFKGVLVTTAWKGVGASSLANLYCDTVGGMIDRHNYFGGGAGGHRIAEGDVRNGTHLDQPGHGLLNLGLFQVADMPFAVSEWSMMPPAEAKAEAAPLYAFYGMGLQGWDASYHFALGGDRFGDGWPRESKYVTDTPHYLGQFPALAFAIHHRHIEEGEEVSERHVGPREVYAGRDALGQSIAEGGHDTKELGNRVATPPETLAVGRVTIAFDKGMTRSDSLAPYWDKTAKTLTATTGQLRWDYGKRFVELRTDKTQAVVGFAGGETVRLPSVEVALQTPFVSLLFTPLDNEPLEASNHILITAMARDKQTGTVYSKDRQRLQAMGAPPLLLEPVEATIRLKGDAPASVRPLDLYGVPIDRSLPIEDGRFTIDGRYAACYYEVRR